jgi:hypothetical protein
MVLRLTDATVSALECAGLDIAETVAETALAAAWQGRTLTVTRESRDMLFEVLNDLSNSEDAAAIDGPIEMRKYARRASLSLGALASRVLRSADK